MTNETNQIESIQRRLEQVDRNMFSELEGKSVDFILSNFKNEKGSFDVVFSGILHKQGIEYTRFTYVSSSGANSNSYQDAMIVPSRDIGGISTRNNISLEEHIRMYSEMGRR